MPAPLPISSSGHWNAWPIVGSFSQFLTRSAELLRRGKKSANGPAQCRVPLTVPTYCQWRQKSNLHTGHQLCHQWPCCLLLSMCFPQQFWAQEPTGSPSCTSRRNGMALPVVSDKRSVYSRDGDSCPDATFIYKTLVKLLAVGAAERKQSGVS